MQTSPSVTLSGRWFTTSPAPADLATGAIAIGTDLAPLSSMVDLAILGPADMLVLLAKHPDIVESDAFIFTSKLPALEGGQLLGLRILGGRLEVSVLEQPMEVPEAVLEALAHAVEVAGGPASVAEVVANAVSAVGSQWPEVLPPLEGVLLEAGLSCAGDQVGPAGYRWQDDARSDEAAAMAVLFMMNETDTESLRRALAVVDSHDLLSHEGVDQTSELLDCFANPFITEALATLRLGSAPDALDDAANSVAAIAEGTSLANALWMRASVADRIGQSDITEKLLNQAIDADPGHGPTAERLAGFASLRGDALGALALLERAQVPTDDRQVKALKKMLALTSPTTGRNDPCPCGSKKKFKKCHGRSGDGASLIALSDRFGWLYEKGLEWVRHPARREFLADLAATSTREGDEPEPYGYLDDTFLLDIALFEGRLWDGFLADWGPMLPEDEQLLAAEWALAERNLFVAVMSTKKDLLAFQDSDDPSAEPLEVADAWLANHLFPGDHFIARVSRGVGELRFIGPVETLYEAEEPTAIRALLNSAPDHTDMADWLGGRPRIKPEQAEAQ